jgi:nitrate reductase cytochrome c-type subunit
MKKKAKEDMTERQLLAHIRKIKREVGKELMSMTRAERVQNLHDTARQFEKECGIKLDYVDRPPLIQHID